MMFISLGIGAVLAIALITVVSYLTGGTVTNTAGQSALIGTKIAPFSGTDTAGTKVSAPWAEGKPAVLVFFASWCAPCHAELPVVSSYLTSHSLGQTQVVGINYLDQQTKGVALATSSKFTFPILEDAGSITQGDFDFSGLPDTVFVNAKGVVTAVHSGVISVAQLRAGLATLG